jgi:RHS repeat-associated protein
MNRITQYLPLDDLQTDDELFAFDGNLHDLDAGLNYHRNRHYDSTAGKWLEESPVGYEGDDVNVTPYVGQQLE